MSNTYITQYFFYLSVPALAAHSLHATDKRLALEVKPANIHIQQSPVVSHDDAHVLAITLIKHHPKSLRLNGHQTLTVECAPGIGTKLQGTLYQANSKNTLTLSQEYVVGDGIWDEQSQQLTITFEKPVSLKVRTTFYLVLTIPQAHAQNLDNQMLAISTHNFPFISEHQKCFCQIPFSHTSNAHARS